jgi:uncharacterized SAM-binding protein YcdF (DUF218 family)
MTAPRGAGRFDPYGRTAPLPPAVAPRPDPSPAEPRYHEPDDAGPVPVPERPPARRRVAPRRGFWSETWRWVVTFALFAVLAASLAGGILLLVIHRQARMDQAGPADAIVVLGTAQFNGVPGPVLQSRLDHALNLYWEGLAPVIVVTGGRMPGDQFTEAEAAAEYLAAMGVPRESILLENDGRDSWESMQGVARIASDWGMPRLLLVSDGFHLFRLKMMARDLGLSALASPSANSPIRPGGPGERAYIVREAAAVVEHLLRRF